MNYPIPANRQEVAALRQSSVNEELVAAALVGVIHIARSEGRSLEELIKDILADDALLDLEQRQRLSEIVAATWKTLP